LRTLKFLFAVFCFASAFFALRIGLANQELVSIRLDLERILETTQTVEPETLNGLIGRIDTASQYGPFLGEADYLRGRLSELQTLRHPRWSDITQREANVAAGNYRSALGNLPMDAAAWAGLASVLSLRVDLDREFYRALDNAMFYGAWVPFVQDSFFRTGMRRWKDLDTNQQERFKAVIIRTLDFPKRDEYIFHTAFFYHWEDHLFELLKKPGHTELFHDFEYEYRGYRTGPGVQPAL